MNFNDYVSGRDRWIPADKEVGSKLYVNRKFPEHDSVNPFLHDMIVDNAKRRMVTLAYQTDYQLIDQNRDLEEIDSLFTWIQNIIPECVADLAENCGSLFNGGVPEESKVFKIAEYWGMYYPERSGTIKHNHFPYPICFAYYVNVPKGSSPFTLDGEDIPVESGDIIFFRGDQYHEVKKCLVGERTMISGNICYDAKLNELPVWT